MREKSRPETDYHHQRFMQISESHCGPAVVQMMLANLGIEVTQEDIAEAAGVRDLIEMHGTRVDQLALAVKRLAPPTRFYVKEHATLQDLVTVVHEHGYPAGVEWQGLFEGDPDTEEALSANLPLAPFTESDDTDYGHYSLVIRAHPERQVFIIADPYKDYFAQDRIFTFRELNQRWFDYNEITDPKTGKKRLKRDEHLMFVIVMEDETFPGDLGMKPY